MSFFNILTHSIMPYPRQYKFDAHKRNANNTHILLYNSYQNILRLKSFFNPIYILTDSFKFHLKID